jgi:branched-subunit amino acid ABC-type transport system permease component
MRTEFGRSLRAGLGDRPWVSCPGVGTAQVTRMVRKAAVWGAKAASAKRKSDEGD